MRYCPSATIPQPKCASQPTGPVSVYTKYRPETQLSRTRKWHGSGQGDPYISTLAQECLRLVTSFSNTITVWQLVYATSAWWVWPFARLHCFLFFSPRLTPRVLSEVNPIIYSFDEDVAQLRDMRMNRLIFFPSPELKFVLNTESKKESNDGIHLPTGTCISSRQTETFVYIFHFNIIRWLHNEFSRLTHVIYTYLTCVISRLSSSPHQLKQFHKCLQLIRILAPTIYETDV